MEYMPTVLSSVNMERGPMPYEQGRVGSEEHLNGVEAGAAQESLKCRNHPHGMSSHGGGPPWVCILLPAFELCDFR